MNRRKVELTTGGLTPSELKLDVKAAENRSLNPAPPEETRSVLTGRKSWEASGGTEASAGATWLGGLILFT